MSQASKDENQLEENQKSMLGIWDNTKEFLHSLLDIRGDSDRNETIESVRKDISFQGHNAWILVFSIFVASIGLNVSSTAVVIGAMLISPLMGPIVGVGLGVAINDDRMLRRSMINLGVMVGLSLITATLYFALTPISQFTPELQARTYPTILDVLVAIFGGLALIVAKAKKGTISNAIAGVAIATALMPPLCTAGYGIAEWNIEIFGGAMYLFSINTVFIGLSTFVVCKMLGFPMVKYANQKQRRKVSRIATLVGLLVLAPSVYLFVQLYQTQVRQTAIEKFMKDYVQYDGTRASFEYDPVMNQLDIVLFGAPVPEEILKQWKSKMGSIEELAKVIPRFYQGSSVSANGSFGDVTALQEERINDIKLLQNQSLRIVALEAELNRIKASKKDFQEISEEVHLLFPELKTIAYAPSVTKNFDTQKLDTVDVFTVSYKPSSGTPKEQSQISKRLKMWLKFRIQADSVMVRNRQPSS